ncbi:hypothetical protein [Pseudalkalibacillus caeni]|uniref:ABC transporter substrate-binding protein n=1 Tax=Exobacillus caeni TaxID=2574798 RepID=A0A5R9F4E4_9BACL|nr:hypothetical protein [Pseudalkalibacillus caeni]TLS37226.1 hypothetical protein FCL54_11925 [Pseudalkalibacillus caeni]
MKLKSISLALTFALIGALLLTPFSTMAASSSTTGSKILKNIKVTGTLEDGGTFDGMLTIEQLSYDEVEGLLMSGEVKGEATNVDGVTTDVKETFENVPATLTEATDSETAQAASLMDATQQQAQAEAECDILNLDLGPIFLDLLGLQLDLSEINLDLTAVPGSGNLLGNLLCQVAGLLDDNGLLSGVLDQVSGLLDSLLGQINSLLG